MNAAEKLTAEDKQNLVAYLDGELEDAAARALEAKLQRSETARQEAETLRKTWEMLDYLPRPKAAETFTHQTLDRLEKRKVTQSLQRRRFRWAAAALWIAGLAAAGVLGFLLVHEPAVTPPPEPTAEEVQLLEHREYWPYYEKVDSVKFLRELSTSDLFGSDS